MDKEEDLKSIDSGIDRILSGNDKISDEFKDMTRACFGRIFYMLGEKNFKRWIDRRQLNPRIKELIVESMSEKDMEVHPAWSGFYTPTQNIIKLSTTLDKNQVKDVNVHETFHFITDSKYFCRFLNEGLTEYMKGMAINRSITYASNVNFVRFLHQTLGDSIIKAYLTGKTEIVDEQLLNMINYDGSANLSEVETLYDNLDKFHEFEASELDKKVFEMKGATPEIIDRATRRFDNAKKEYEQAEPQILLMCQRIIIGKISQMSKNMEFYRNGEAGELDLENASKLINTLVKQVNIRTFLRDKSNENVSAWEEQTSILAIEQVLENSHILMGYSDQERETRKQELIETMLPTYTTQIMQDRKGRITKQTTSFPPKIKNTDILPEENANITSKLFEKFLTDDMSITQYIETFSRIAGVTGINNEELENYLNKYNIKYFGNLSNFRDINSLIISSIPKIQKLNELQEERRKDTIASEYKSIGNGRFIEKRDNQIFYVELDEDGTFTEQEVKYLSKTIFLKDGHRLDIDCSKGLPNLEVRINNQIIQLGDSLSLQDIKDMGLADTFSKGIRSNIETSQYTTILDDAENPWEIDGVKYSADIDKRSREIDFHSYIQDLKNIISIIPESQKNRVIRESTKLLLDKTYGISKNYESQTISELYDSTLSAVMSLVESDNIKQDAENYKILEGNSKKLQEIRTEMVEENNSKSMVIFRDETARREYQELKNEQEQRIKRQKSIENQKKQIQESEKMKKYVGEASSKFNYSDFYSPIGTVPVDEMPFHLAGVSTTQLVDTRGISFSYNEFATATKEMISRYPEQARSEIFNKIFRIQMQRAYFLDKNDFCNPEIKDSIESVRSIISEKIFSGKEIDEEQISSNLSALSHFKIEKAKQGQKVAAVSFKNEDTKNTFFSLTKIIENVKKLGIRDGMIEKEVQELVNTQLQIKQEEKTDEQPDIK